MELDLLIDDLVNNRYDALTDDNKTIIKCIQIADCDTCIRDYFKLNESLKDTDINKIQFGSNLTDEMKLTIIRLKIIRNVFGFKNIFSMANPGTLKPGTVKPIAMDPKEMEQAVDTKDRGGFNLL